MLRRLLYAWGRGSGKIKLILSKNTWKQGEMLQGELHITGGSEQLREVRVDLIMSLITMKGREHIQSLFPLVDMKDISLEKGEKTVLSFSHYLPETIAISCTHIMYGIQLQSQTIHEDPYLIDIVPNEPLRQVIGAFYNLDFRRHPSFGSFDGRTQHFTFVPAGYFMRMLTSVDFLAVQQEKDIRLLMHILDSKGHDLYHVSKFSHWEWKDADLLIERLRKEMTDMCSEPDSYMEKFEWVEAEAVGSLANGLFPEHVKSSIDIQ